ncbi:glycosyltransferase family 4 protein [Mucilaginibacter flavus]|uniref:glycosyltransferase family 4 protein n=1 Tax=Mucilaginibacter flavus TaxID=931504 RepID=UPI0025B2C296|nr:glycosyltransferase family 4 protein [Mucilaginibacter flavus]MDN3584406.1 glycosyltransferase family 4 protein [Mucilaginibacter flavus]
MKKHLVIVDLFEFGGSNSHLKTLIKYWGKANVVIVLKHEDQLAYLNNIEDVQGIQTRIYSSLYQYAHLSYRFTTNFKELCYIIRAIFLVQLLSIRYGFADVNISTVDPEKYLYLLWLPFARVFYTLHSTPGERYTWFTTFTCNYTLGNRKKIITVSNANRDLICKKWRVSLLKENFVYAVYNCILEDGPIDTSQTKSDGLIILTMGHVIDYKNPGLWLKVAKMVIARHKHVTFVWLGNGPLWDEFKAASESIERVLFMGAVHNPVPFLKSALIYYQPSLSETQGIAVVEAMSQSLPCVVSETGGLPETVVHGYNGFVVNPTIVQDHVEAISALLNAPAIREEFGLNARKRVSELFSFGSFKKKMDALYL